MFRRLGLLALLLIILSGMSYAVNIAACSNLSYAGTYTLTADITDRATTCFSTNVSGITLDLNGHTVDGTRATSSFGLEVNNSGTTIINGIVKEFDINIYTGYTGVANAHNLTIQNVTSKDARQNGLALLAPTVTAGYHGLVISNSTFSSQYGAGNLINARLSLNGTFTNVNIDCSANTSNTGLVLVGYYSQDSKLYALTNVTITNCAHALQIANAANKSTTIYGRNVTIIGSNIADVYMYGATSIPNVTTTLMNLSFSNTVPSLRFAPTSGDLNETVYLINCSGINGNFIRTYPSDNATAYSQRYVLFNFTLSDGTPQTSNYQLNNSLNGVIKNETAAASGLGTWTLVNDTRYQYSNNLSYNPYTLNAHPSSAGYAMNTSILSFTNTGVWNITFYTSYTVTASAVTLCNSTACSALGTLYIGNSALNASGICTGATPMNGTFTFYRNGTFYNSCMVQNWVTAGTNYSTCGVAASAIKKSDTWTVGLNCSTGAFTSLQVNASGKTVNNTAPLVGAPALTPSSPTTVNTLTCAAGSYTDADGDAKGAEYFTWYRNNNRLMFLNTSDTVTYLKFDEMRNDLAVDSAGNNNGVLVNFPADSTIYDPFTQASKWAWDGCISGSCVNFSTTSTSIKYVDLGNSTAFGTVPFTAEAWIYLSSINNNAAGHIIFGKDSYVSGQRQWYVKYNPAAESFQLIVFNSTGVGEYIYPGISYSNSTVVGKKFFIVVKVNSTHGSLYLYNTSGLVSSNSTAFGAVNGMTAYSPIKMIVGSRADLPSAINGTVDDFRFFNTDRTEAQIESDFIGYNSATLDLTKLTVHPGDWFNCSYVAGDSGYSAVNVSGGASNTVIASEKSNYWAMGTTHAHQWPYPWMYITYFREKGYDWLGSTDYSTYPFDVWDSSQTINGAFVSVHGQEVTQVPDFHMIALNISGNQSSTNVQTIINNVTGSTNYGVLIIAHPQATSSTWSNISLYDDYTGIEVFNKAFSTPTVDAYAESAYNNASIQAPQKLRAPFAADDMHYMPIAGYGWIKVYVDGTITNQKVIEGIRAKKFYAVRGDINNSGSMDMDVNPFKVNSYDMGTTHTNGTISATATVNASEAISRIELYFTNTSNVYLMLNQSCGSTSCALSYTNSTYLASGSWRIKAYTTAHNYQLWSAPIYVTSNYTPPQYPEVSAATLCGGTACGAIGTLYVSSSALNCSALVVDNDTAVIPQVRFSFRRNGTEYFAAVKTNAANNTTVYPPAGVAASAIKKSDTWTCSVTAYDGALNSTASVSAGATVNNTAPILTEVHLNAVIIRTTDVITCLSTYTDADGDAAGTAYYRWWKSGAEQVLCTSSSCNMTTISAVMGDTINCSMIRADTGYSIKNSTEVFSAAGTVQYAPTVVQTNLTFLNGSAIDTLYVTNSLNCSFYATTTVNTTMNATVRYYGGGQLIASHSVTGVQNATITWAASAYSFPATPQAKGNNYYCSVQVYDGTYSYFVDSLQYTVNNTAPTIGDPMGISAPNSRYTNNTVLTCEGAYSDADGDARGIGYARWFKNDVDTGFTTQSVNSNSTGLNTTNGDIVYCIWLSQEDTGYDKKNSSNSNLTSAPVIIGSVNYPELSPCSYGGYPVLNFTLYDEKTLASLNGSMDAILEVYNVSDNSLLSNTSFTITNSHTFDFCINQYAATVKVNSIHVYSSPGYSTRDYYIIGSILNASTPIVTNLYLLNTSLVTAYTFQTVNQYVVPISGVKISVLRFLISENAWVTIEQRITDFAGYGYFSLEPGTLYKLTAEADSYITVNVDFTPGAITSVQIRMLTNGTTVTPVPNFEQVFNDVSYSITPATYFHNGTTPAQYQVSSASNSLASYGMVITRRYNGTTSVVFNTSVDTSPGGGILNYTAVDPGEYTMQITFNQTENGVYSPMPTKFFIGTSQGAGLSKDLFATGFINGWAYYFVALVITMVCAGFALRYSPEASAGAGLLILWLFTFLNLGGVIVTVAGVGITVLYATILTTLMVMAAMLLKWYV